MGRSRKEEFIAKERSKKVNNMISTELAGEAIPASDTEAVRELCVDYTHNKDEYLVEGARLTCDKALPLPHINSTETTLKVPCSVAKINGKKVATIKDHEINVNIKPFECDCANGPLGNEQNTITDLEDCRLHGTCKYLMKLNDDWENLIRDVGYFSFGRKIRDDKGNEMVEKAKGITMMSALFCSNGGLITPVDSGQWGCAGAFALACTSESGNEHTGSLSWEEMKMNAEYIYGYLLKQGWSTQAICGLLGNIYVESHMNPGVWQVWNDDSGFNTRLGYGLVQWSPAEDYLTYMELDKSTYGEINEKAANDLIGLMDSQLEYLLETMKQGRWIIGKKAQKYYNLLPLSPDVSGRMKSEEFMESTANPGDLALVFQACYERSRDGVEGLQKRACAAEIWYAYFIGENQQISLADFSN